MGFFFDINNYFFVQKCFKLMPTHRKMWERMKLNISPVGVLWCEVKIDRELGEKHHKVFLDDHFTELNMLMMEMNLDGLIVSESIRLSPIEDEKDDNIIYERYIIKFIPSMKNVTLWNAIKIATIVYIIYKLIRKNWEFLHLHAQQIIDYIIS